MKQFLKDYLSHLQDTKDSMSVRHVFSESLESAALRLRIRWCSCKIGFVETILGEEE